MSRALTPLRAVLALLCAALALWFLLPMPFGVVSIANFAGVLGFGLLAWGILRWPQLLHWLQTLWGRRGMRVLLIALGILLAALVIWAAVLTGQVLSCMHPPAQEADTVIVLGCQVRGTQPSMLLYRRIVTAADYLKEHPEAVCIVSGGQGSGENITEAACMARELTARGIDAARILLEDRSTSTKENLAFSLALMQAHGLSQPVLLVSNNFHLYRALQFAEACGLEACGLPAPCDWYMLPTYILREVLALMKYQVFG